MSAAKVNDPWTDYEAPAVEETDEPFKYRVSSRSEPALHHTVDLTQRGGHGCCTCKHFQFVANANFRRHQTWIPYAPGRNGVSECPHIRAAWDYYHLQVTVPMMAKFKNGIATKEAEASPHPR